MSRNLERKLSAFARELAFKAIFQIEFNNNDDNDKETQWNLAINNVTGKLDIDSETEKINEDVAYVDEVDELDENVDTLLKLKPKHLEYIEKVVKNTMDKLSEIDEIISKYLKSGWSIQRLAAVDRNILRLAIYELKFDEANLSERIIINDVVNIAKKYGTEHSSRFVNGILGAIVK